MRLIDADMLKNVLNSGGGESVEISISKKMPLGEIVDTVINAYRKCLFAELDKIPTAYDVENPWILCSEKLPEEPEEIPTEDEPVEEMMLDGKFKEYIVAIWGAYESTTLYYIGNNEWYDGISGTYYKVIAWQPMPEVYKGLDR